MSFPTGTASILSPLRRHPAERSSEGGEAADPGLPNNEAAVGFLEARDRSEAERAGGTPILSD
jgi:hypothetical protein